MRFVVAVLLALGFVSVAGAIHPPVEPGPTPTGQTGNPGTTGQPPGGPHITGFPTPSVSSPEPAAVTLALLGLLGGGGYGLLRRRK